MLVQLILLVACTFSNTIAWQSATNQEDTFKLQLFRRAMKLATPRDLDITLEVATALRADDVYVHYISKANEQERQRILGLVAEYAAKYGRPNLATKLSLKMDDSSNKMEAFCQTAMALGYANERMQFDLLIQHLEKIRKTAIAPTTDDDAEHPFKEFTADQWRECLMFAYHAGAAAAGKPISNDLNRDVSTVLFRDTIRAYRVQKMLAEGQRLQAPLTIIRSMESVTLKIKLLQQLLKPATKRSNHRYADLSPLGKELFNLFCFANRDKAYAQSNQFELFEKFDFGVSEPIDGIPWQASRLISDVFALDGPHWPLASSRILQACIRSGFCTDGVSQAMLIENDQRKAAWLNCVIKRFEQRNDLKIAWSVREKFHAALKMTLAERDTNRVRQIELACQREKFDLAESFVAQLKTQQREATFILAAYRQNPQDRKLVKEKRDQWVVEFEQKLAQVKQQKQLEWLYRQCMRTNDNPKLLLLSENIKLEFEKRKRSSSRDKVARMVNSAIHSMTPIGKVRKSLMQELALILKIDRANVADSESVIEPYSTLESVLKELDNLDAEVRLDSNTKVELLDRCVKACEASSSESPDDLLGKVAQSFAKHGAKEEVVKLIEMIEEDSSRFYALMNCVMVFPPESMPLVRGIEHELWKRQGGFLPGGHF